MYVKYQKNALAKRYFYADFHRVLLEKLHSNRFTFFLDFFFFLKKKCFTFNLKYVFFLFRVLIIFFFDFEFLAWWKMRQKKLLHAKASWQLTIVGLVILKNKHSKFRRPQVVWWPNVSFRMNGITWLIILSNQMFTLHATRSLHGPQSKCM